MNTTTQGSWENLYAHSLKDRPKKEWQLLQEHLQHVADMAAEFAKAFSSSDWAHQAAWLHDLGKADPAFQAYLLRSNGLDDPEYDTNARGRVNHSSAGAAYAVTELSMSHGRILAYLAAGHHAGLPDWYPTETGNAALEIRVKEGDENLKRIEHLKDPVRESLRNLTRPDSVRAENCHMWMRMLFSCLVDADYLDTENFMDPDRQAARIDFKNIAQLADSLERHLADKMAQAPKTPVNQIRKEVLDSCIDAAKCLPGFFSLTVPTGGGKTLSAMAFALQHALKSPSQTRVIYVIPYTSIIEQTAKVLRGIFGDDQVVEHHSNLDPDKETQRSRLASENWDAPIVVTTSVQFFESLYAARPGRCRKLHNIVNAVVILDEVQLLPPELLAPCVDALNDLVRNYGVTVLLSTATQPCLASLPRPCPSLDSVREIIADPAALYESLQRTEWHFPESPTDTMEWEEVATRLQEHDQVLCVVNRRKDCFELFQYMPEGTIHLSALMCPEHRSTVIEEIRQRLGQGEPTRVVSTQLVEAGVDIDFPVVYRAFAGLDSIAQAAGRCNREGTLKSKGQVHVFNPPKLAPPGILRKGEDAARELLSLHEIDPQNPAAFPKFFHQFYARVNDYGGARFTDLLVKDVNPRIEIQFRTAAKEFHIIDDAMSRPVIVRYKNSERLIEQLRQAGPTRDIMRKLQRYTVSLPVRMLEQMKLEGLLEEIPPGIYAQTLPSLYSLRIGLDVFGRHIDATDLIVD